MGDSTAETSEQKLKSRPTYDRNLDYSEQFDEQLKAQRGNLWISSIFTLIVLSIGLVATVHLFRTSAATEYLKLGPMALSSISLPFPLRMYLTYRIRAPIYRRLKRRFEEAAENGSEPDPDMLDEARNALKALHKLD